MNSTDYDPAEAGKVFTGTIDEAIAQIRADAPAVSPEDRTSRDPQIFLGQYNAGYQAGKRDGEIAKRNGSGIEQDFAYKHADYERGYWAAFQEHRK